MEITIRSPSNVILIHGIKLLLSSVISKNTGIRFADGIRSASFSTPSKPSRVMAPMAPGWHSNSSSMHNLLNATNPQTPLSVTHPRSLLWNDAKTSLSLYLSWSSHVLSKHLWVTLRSLFIQIEHFLFSSQSQLLRFLSFRGRQVPTAFSS